MKKFIKRGTAVPFFTPIIAIIVAIIILVCSFIWNAYIEDVNDSVESEQTQEYVSE
jgi:Ca2+-dependent lipid-binding protein